MKEVWQKTMELWKNVQGPFLIVLAAGVFIVLMAYLYMSVKEEKTLLQVIDKNGTRTLILLLAGAIGWYFVNRRTITAEGNTKAAEESAQATIKNTEIAEQGLTTERLTSATEQLANKNSSVRLGGILGLEQIAKTHEEERKKIARVLVSFIPSF